MKFLVSTSAAVVLALLQAPPAPSPDFSGSWTIDSSRSQSSGSVTLEIKHTATEISIETNKAGKISKVSYPLEPTPHLATEAIATGHSHAYWRDKALVTETAGEIQGQTVSFRQTRTLNEAGTEMSVETLTVVQHGYAAQGAKNYSSAKDVYVRAK
jgi:hypothetical protein